MTMSSSSSSSNLPGQHLLSQAHRALAAAAEGG